MPEHQSNKPALGLLIAPSALGGAVRRGTAAVVGESHEPSLAPASATSASGGERRLCTWCERPLPDGARVDARYCGQKHRQAAWRLARRSGVVRVDVGDTSPGPRQPVVRVGEHRGGGRRVAHDVVSDAPARFAYADPPYPGRARKWYRDEPTYAGEVDHAELIASLTASEYDGWALSTAADALRDVLPLCPPQARVCAWVKPISASTRTYGLHNTWEPLVVVGGRRRRPGVRDWLRAQPARFEGELSGRKPIAFCAWLFDCLGMQPGDELADLFPGTGIVGRAWAVLSSSAAALDDASPGSRRRVVEVLADVDATGLEARLVA